MEPMCYISNDNATAKIATVELCKLPVNVKMVFKHFQVALAEIKT